jgi:hypothetical protein
LTGFVDIQLSPDMQVLRIRGSTDHLLNPRSIGHNSPSFSDVLNTHLNKENDVQNNPLKLQDSFMELSKGMRVNIWDKHKQDSTL